MDQKRLEEFVPTSETEKEPFQVDKYGNFRIVVKGRTSSWTRSDKIASIIVDDETYIGATDRLKEILPTMSVLKVEKVDEDGETDFYRFKIVDLIEDRILDEDDVLDHLREPMSDVDFNIIVNTTMCKDFVKIKIIEYAPFGSKEENKVLNEEEVRKFIIDAFSAEEFDVYDRKEDVVNKR